MLNWFRKLWRRSSGLNADELLRMAQTALAAEANGSAKESVVVPANGRSSVEEFGTIHQAMQQMLGWYGDGLQDERLFQALEFLCECAPYHPDINHALNNLVNMANSGHSVSVETGSDRATEAAQERLNQQAHSLYKRSAGIDGLINHYLRQIMITGAISSEDVLTGALDGVEKIAIVPTRKIRFQADGDDYAPFQKTNDSQLIALHPATYRYFALQTNENSPYALPPFAAAIDDILIQTDMKQNLKFIMRKFGLLGLVAMVMNKGKKKPSETESEYNARMSKHQNDTLVALQKNFYKGLMVMFEDKKIEHHNITGDARAAKDIWNLIRQNIASGMATDPVLFGIPTNSTETFANVIYMFIIRQANNVRRLVARRMECTYRLDFLLQGLPVEGVSFRFEKNPARDPLAEGQAQATIESAAIKKAQVGMIEPDVAAQELGYDGWHDPALMHGAERVFGVGDDPGLRAHGLDSRLRGNDGALTRRTFRLNSGREQYEFVRPRVLVQASAHAFALASEETVRKTLAKWQKEYLDAIRPFLGEQVEEAVEVLAAFIRRSKLSDFRDEKAFAEAAFATLSTAFNTKFQQADARKVVKDSVKEIYEFYRLEDKAAFPKSGGVAFAMDSIDKRSLNFMTRLERHYLSKFIFNQNTEKQVLDFLQTQFLENGDGLFGRTSRDAIQTLQALAVDRLESLTEYEAERIINTGVQRMRAWANIGQMSDSGVRVAEIFNPSPESEICKFMVNEVKYLPVGEARKAVDELSQLTPRQFAGRLRKITPEEIASEGIVSATRNGYGFPTYHPNCATRLLETERDAV